MTSKSWLPVDRKSTVLQGPMDPNSNTHPLVPKKHVWCENNCSVYGLGSMGPNSNTHPLVPKNIYGTSILLIIL
jgi:hypothetical protein